jgi:hypothetical protein
MDERTTYFFLKYVLIKCLIRVLPNRVKRGYMVWNILFESLNGISMILKTRKVYFTPYPRFTKIDHPSVSAFFPNPCKVCMFVFVFDGHYPRTN